MFLKIQKRTDDRKTFTQNRDSVVLKLGECDVCCDDGEAERHQSRLNSINPLLESIV